MTNDELLELVNGEHASEALVLGTLMLFGEGIERCEKLDSRHFASERHQRIWQTMRDLSDQGLGYGGAETLAALHDSGQLVQAGGATYLLQLAEVCGISCALLEQHASMLVNRWLKREVERTAVEIRNEARMPGAEAGQVIEDAQRDFLLLQQQREQRSEIGMRELVRDVTKTAHLGEATGIATGFGELDAQTRGLNPGALVVVAARPAMGKTAFALNIVAQAAIRAKEPAAFFSLEMSARELGHRLVSCVSRIPADRCGSKAMTDTDYVRYDRATNDLLAAPLTVVDANKLTVHELRSHALKLHAQGKCKLLVVDYLQLMTGEGETREREIGDISRGLKLVAKELKIPVVALAQLNRGVETRTEKRPGLADLRDSGAIEQDADMVWFLYRDEVYNESSRDKGIAEVIVAKHRSGPTGKIRLRFDAPTQRFESLTH